MFKCPYQTDQFPVYAEKEGGHSWQLLSDLAREKAIYLIGGSVPELDNKKIYNTSYIFNDEGILIAKHRKVYLFDIDIEEGQSFKESDTLNAGNSATVFSTPFGKIGVVICYDFRFPELIRLTVQKGARMIIVPGAFNMTTGPAHWEILFRTRAVDNQVFTVGVAPARNEKGNYISYGNSLIVDPWGEVMARMGGEEGIIIKEIDFKKVNKIRNELPLLKHLRYDIY